MWRKGAGLTGEGLEMRREGEVQIAIWDLILKLAPLIVGAVIDCKKKKKNSTQSSLAPFVLPVHYLCRHLHKRSVILYQMVREILCKH